MDQHTGSDENSKSFYSLNNGQDNNLKSLCSDSSSSNQESQLQNITQNPLYDDNILDSQQFKKRRKDGVVDQQLIYFPKTKLKLAQKYSETPKSVLQLNQIKNEDKVQVQNNNESKRQLQRQSISFNEFSTDNESKRKLQRQSISFNEFNFDNQRDEEEDSIETQTLVIPIKEDKVITRNYIKSLAEDAKHNNLSKKYDKGNTLLNLCIINNYNDLIPEFINFNSVKIPNDAGNTPLIEAAQQQSMYSFSQCLKYETDVDTQNNEGKSALQILIQLTNYKLCEILLKNNASANSENKKTLKTPIKISLDDQNLNIANLLLKHNAEINSILQFNGQTLLGDMFINKNIKGVKFLLRNSVNLFSLNRQGQDIRQVMNNHINTLHNSTQTVQPNVVKQYYDMQKSILYKYYKQKKSSKFSFDRILFGLQKCFSKILLRGVGLNNDQLE